jgi:hypothetical protein
MPIVVLTCLALIGTATVIHYEALRLLSTLLPGLRMAPRARVVIALLGAFAAHLLEVGLYGVAAHALAHGTGLGAFSPPQASDLLSALYFSAATYTSLGYGDIQPLGALRAIASVECLHGLLLIGWTASYLYVSMAVFWTDEAVRHEARER